MYNGNISEVFWRSSNDDIKRKYGFAYDELNRLLKATYYKPDAAVALTKSYDEQMTYDKNGNITHLNRNGGQDLPYYAPLEIDNLTYKYDSNDNKLKGVHDSSNSLQGFKDKSGSTLNDIDYTYDVNGNMITDANKGITSIKYNHLNLPTEIIFNNNNSKKINYIYNAEGFKLQKVVTQGTQITITDYLDGFQHKDAVLQFFPHAEGYVTNTQTIKNDGLKKDNFNYVYNYLDHLGNIRVSYAWDYDLNVLKIVEENGYYPFGLKHSGYNSDLKIHKAVLNETRVELKAIPGGGETVLDSSMYKYKYNGKELQDELGLNMYDYGARNYDPSLGRWMNVDPLAEMSRKWSPYVYAYNSPLRFTDPDGMIPDDKVEDKKEETIDYKALTLEKEESAKISEEINAEFKKYLETTKSEEGDSSDEDDQEGKKVTKKSAGIAKGDTAETMIAKILKAMKSGDYIDGSDLDFLNSNIGYLIDEATMGSNGNLNIDRTMAGGIAGIGKDAKLTLKAGSIGNMKGYNFELTGVSASVKNKIYTSGFINDNKLYFYEKGKLLSVPIK